MSDTPRQPSATGGAWLKLPNRSIGLKIILVGFLALCMTLPALFIGGLASERQRRAETVRAEIGQPKGGAQVFTGPVIGVPYTARQPGTDAQGRPITTETRGVYYVFAQTGRADARAAIEVLERSIYKAPVYTADMTFDAVFDLRGVQPALEGLTIQWDRAELLVGASNLRGAVAPVSARWCDGSRLELRPLSGAGVRVAPPPAPAPRGRPAMTETTTDIAAAPPVQTPGRASFDATTQLMTADIGALLPRDRPCPVKVGLKFTGAQSIGFLPYARNTEVRLASGWPHPSFQGAYLPSARNIEGDGFTASWNIPYVARGVGEVAESDGLIQLGQAGFHAALVEGVDPYQSLERALKFALLFVGIVFLVFFLFEVTAGGRVHAAQYLLIGVAQMNFYILLLALSEHVGFTPAFLIAAVATVGLISLYAGTVFGSRRRALVAAAVFAATYALLYLLMRLEDLALLVGAVAAFAAVAATMFVTRKIDWYGGGEKPAEGAPAR
jgi:inner membrane protein